jgi:hypothetical protein
MEIELGDTVEAWALEHGLSRDDMLDAAVLPDVIEELPRGKKEFFKRVNDRFLRLEVLVKEQSTIIVLSAEWATEIR